MSSKLRLVAAAAAFLLLASAHAAGGGVAKASEAPKPLDTQQLMEAQKAVDALVAQRKYAAAARYIDKRPELTAQPRFVRQLTQLLTSSYLVTLNYRMFGLRDLAAGEDLRKLRGQPGHYEIIGGDLEQRLHDALERWPADPEIQLAVGEYLSRGKDCGCHNPELFQGEAADPYPYLERAQAAGLSDAWSLFALGTSRLSAGDAAKARAMLVASLAQDPSNLNARYHLAIACFSLGDYAAAQDHAAQVAGRYGDPRLDADAYHVLGRCGVALGDMPAAEKALAQALTLQPSHAEAFMSLLDILRQQHRFTEYKQRAAAFVALDYGNTWPFAVYLSDVAQAGVADADRELGRDLEARVYATPKDVGAVFYGLGKLAELDNDRPRAHACYEKALEGLRRQEKPPEGAIGVVSQLVERTAATPAKE